MASRKKWQILDMVYMERKYTCDSRCWCLPMWEKKKVDVLGQKNYD